MKFFNSFLGGFITGLCVMLILYFSSSTLISIIHGGGIFVPFIFSRTCVNTPDNPACILASRSRPILYRF